MTFIITKMKILQLVILCLSGKVVFGRENGAPSDPKACDHMVPGHLDPVPIPSKDLSRTPYEVKAEIDGSYVRLSVSGLVSVAGFLIQARQTSNSPAIGEFKLESQSNNSIARYQTCGKEFPQFSSITHTNSNSKPNLTFLWRPIANRAKNINVTFYATLAQSHEIFWVKQPSNEINILDINGTPGRPLIPFWTLSSLVVAFMIHSL
ncbi:Hypothetical predicted protein [Paramuricea clavata]|uniref:Uncharacterized protein n=1 Tax=Paramuricea clavata TaxID=317549 RepID=A0A6S7HG17_PARCT|nr:Hypothetical predicted protein [Paramuricea clavata]